MSVWKHVVLGTVLTMVWGTPMTLWASAGELPVAARATLLRAVSRHKRLSKGKKTAISLQRNRSLSKDLVSTHQVREVDAKGAVMTRDGRAFVYSAEITTSGDTTKGGKYVVVEKFARGEAYWEAHPLAIPLKEDGTPSTVTTKRVTRPDTGILSASFHHDGAGPSHRSAIGVTALKTRVVEKGPLPAGMKVELLAKRVDAAKGTTTFYALGDGLSDSGPTGVVMTQLRAEPVPADHTSWKDAWNAIPLGSLIFLEGAH